MSTFKRLFNVGKGKAKVAQKAVSDSISGTGEAVNPGEWVDSARHAAADAAEVVAGAIRPPERGLSPSVVQPSAESAPRVRSVPEDREAEIEAAEEVTPPAPVDPTGPKKRRL